MVSRNRAPRLPDPSSDIDRRESSEQSVLFGFRLWSFLLTSDRIGKYTKRVGNASGPSECRPAMQNSAMQAGCLSRAELLVEKSETQQCGGRYAAHRLSFERLLASRSQKRASLGPPRASILRHKGSRPIRADRKDVSACAGGCARRRCCRSRGSSTISCGRDQRPPASGRRHRGLPGRPRQRPGPLPGSGR